MGIATVDIGADLRSVRGRPAGCWLNYRAIDRLIDVATCSSRLFSFSAISYGNRSTTQVSGYESRLRGPRGDQERKEARGK